MLIREDRREFPLLLRWIPDWANWGEDTAFTAEGCHRPTPPMAPRGNDPLEFIFGDSSQ
jgi:hypothetical protein